MTLTKLQEEIIELKNKNDVTILAHYYQPMEIQQVADFLGDSLGLSQKAKNEANTEYILFAGVKFMAETASILNQDKKVLIPNPESLCPMAAFLTPEKVKEFKKQYPGVPVVVYVNSTAAVKSESDICCTSSNAVKIVKKISKENNTSEVLFGPDANLADFTEQKSGIKTIKMPANGHCIVHSRLNIEDINKARENYPNANILVHPECVRVVRESVDFVGSTAQMYNFVKDNLKDQHEFVIGTEVGLMERMIEDFPEKRFSLLSDKLVCYNMKKNTIELMKYVLENLDDKSFEVKVPREIAEKALVPIEKMLQYS
ncbi:MAG: quinolinate synthase NadA [Promethearchaeota archaeon]